MLKTPFVPYSEKLLAAAHRRKAKKQSSPAKATALHVGDTVPDFSLYNTAHEETALRDLIGKSNLVLLFFPLAFSDVCTSELCAIRDNMQKYEELNALVLGISIDSMFALNKFKEEQQLPFELLSDFNKDVARRYYVLDEDFPAFNMKGVSKRAAFVVDRKGTIQHVEVSDQPANVPSFQAIEDALNRCNDEHVSSHVDV